jgi:hypothetical protein
LGDDILLEIFDYLDEEDLKSCEKVCARWNCLIKSFYSQIRLYHKKVFSSYYYSESFNENLNHDILEKMSSSEMWQKYLKIRAENQVIPQNRHPKLKIAREVMV